MSATQPHPLELPEILNSVAKYVPDHSLAACARVSKTWHQEFVPFIWRTINLRNRALLPEAIHPHSQHITELHLTQPLPQEFATLTCPNLYFLELMSMGRDCDLSGFIFRHQSLTRLVLDGYSPGFQSTLWEEILGLDNLKDLTIMDIDIDTKDVDKFWQVCTRLERLDFGCIEMETPRGLLSMEFPLMQTFRLTSPVENDLPWLMAFICRCPNLTTFFWEIHGTRSPVLFALNFAKKVSEGTWPYLERLESSTTPNASLSKIMAGMQRITSLKLTNLGDSFGSNCMDILRHHFSNLKELDLLDRGFTSPMAQEVLSSCPLLEVLKVVRIDATDVAAGRPWVCLGLKRLAACFRFDPTTIDQLQPLVFDQLSKLSRLEELNVDGRSAGSSWRFLAFQETFDFRLEMGLDKLSTLRLLRDFSFCYTRQRMTEEEIEWITKHWRRISRATIERSIIEHDSARESMEVFWKIEADSISQMDETWSITQSP
ncbi:MAG: hypothetical protein J3Q66DRAFT_352631 [Benniella sp.]|nr:MAG: hypothetical protein J3Q66DRAFT_352631 [Benniella sp.]